MPNQRIPFNGGVVTVRDPSTLSEGQLQEAVSCEYRKGTSHLHKQPGRATSLTDLGGPVNAIQRLNYDNPAANDLLAAYVKTSPGEGQLHESPVFKKGETSNFTLAITSLNPDAVPHFSGFRDSWIMVNGVDQNRIRESGTVPNSSPPTPWRTLGMSRPLTRLDEGTANSSTSSVTPTSTSTPTEADDIYVGHDGNLNESYDADDDTYAESNITYPITGAITTKTEGVQYDWSGAAAVSGDGRYVYILHEALSSLEIPESGGTKGKSPKGGRIEIYYRNGTGAWIKAYSAYGPFPKSEVRIPIDGSDAVTAADVDIKVLHIVAHSDAPSEPVITDEDAWSEHRIYEIRIDNGHTTAFTTDNAVYYGYTELYVDSNGIWHESAISPLLKVAAKASSVTGILLDDFPETPYNSNAQQYLLYRSLDEAGGGYPYMYRIMNIPLVNKAGGGTFALQDDISISLTDATLQKEIYETLTFLLPSGENLIIETNTPPPISKRVIPFRGSLVFIPINSTRIYYSLAGLITPASIEKVPELYYLEFVTPYSDIIQSAHVCNNGRVLLVYFEQYTMMVTHLPQASDPAGFDQRVTEYVTNTRGCCGTHAATEITLDTNHACSFAAAVDSLGLWITDGVSQIIEWSQNLDWDTAMEGVDLSQIILVNNFEMRRLEMLFEKDAKRYEYHFYYGHMTGTGGESTGLPLITGPHLSRTKSKHFAVVDCSWVGWSGDSTDKGDIYTERAHSRDDSYAYDPLGSVPLSVETGDFYVAGLGRSALVVFGYPKFTAGSKYVNFIGTFVRDGADTPITVTKSHLTNNKKIYWHRYADRHKIKIQDISPDDMPAIVGYEVELRDAGIGRDI